MGLSGLLTMMAIGLGVLVPVALLVVVIMTRRSGLSAATNFVDGTTVISDPGDGSPEVSGTLVRTDNEYALIEVGGQRRFVPRDSLRPATEGRPRP